MAFEQFIPRDIRDSYATCQARKPFVSICRRQFSFSASSMKLFEKIEFVQLFFDEELRCIGFKPCKGNDVGANAIFKHNGHPALCSKRFIDRHKLAYANRIPILWDEKSKMFLASLEE